MKLITVFIITLLIAFDVRFCLKASTTVLNTNLLGSKSVAKKGSAPPTPTISEVFFLQKLYSGKDPILFMEKSEHKPSLKYFVVQGTSFYYGKNSLTSAIIEDQLDLVDLYDKSKDNASEGKCCTRLKSIDYPVVKCNGCMPRPGAPSAQLDAVPVLARFCLEIDILTDIYWRICHRNKDKITRLKLALVRATVKAVKPDVSPDVMTKILMNGSYAPAKAPAGWNWIEQDRWGGNCDSELVQSPLSIVFNPLAPSVQPNFDFEWNFANGVPFYITGNGEEVLVKFDKLVDTGYLKAKFGQTTASAETMDFKPVGMTFRFPAEHKINDNRYDGEIIIDFIEKTPNMDPKTRATEAFRWVFPVIFEQTEPLNKELETLSIDFWRFELEASKVFIPKDFKSDKRSLFDLSDFAEVSDKIKTQYALYMGSQTTPPCLDRVIYLINLTPMKIPNCQFKILRENSLTSNRDRETHARNLQENIRGGPPEIRKILWIEHIKKPLPPPMIIPKPHIPIIPPPSGPDCDIKREISP